MEQEQAKTRRGRKAAMVAAIAGGALGLYSLAAWSLAMFPGGWQLGLAALILLAVPPLAWWLSSGRGDGRG
jgi:hypothetical protein